MKSCCSRCIRRLPLTSQITHSGLCGTDIHYFEYGQVLGHEGVGIVLDIGKNVPENLFSRGDILGFGIQLNVSPPASPLTICDLRYSLAVYVLSAWKDKKFIVLNAKSNLCIFLIAGVSPPITSFHTGLYFVFLWG